MTIEIKCAYVHCRKPFTPRNRSNRYQYAKGQQHEAAAYCSNRCRQAVYRLRRLMGAVSDHSTGLHAVKTTIQPLR